jgi:hypothetical protein
MELARLRDFDEEATAVTEVVRAPIYQRIGFSGDENWEGHNERGRSGRPILTLSNRRRP